MTEQPQFFVDTNNTHWLPLRVINSTVIPPATGHVSCCCEVVKKGRSYVKLGDLAYCDIPKSFLERYYPNLK